MPRPRFSLRFLLWVTTVVAVMLGVWIIGCIVAQQRLARVDALRELGLEVVTFPDPPGLLQALGVVDLSPLFVEARVSTGFHPAKDGAYLSCIPAKKLETEAARSKLLELQQVVREAGGGELSVHSDCSSLTGITSYADYKDDWSGFFEENSIVWSAHAQLAGPDPGPEYSEAFSRAFGTAPAYP